MKRCDACPSALTLTERTTLVRFWGGELEGRAELAGEALECRVREHCLACPANVDNDYEEVEA